jgi:hypothetical protein
MMRKLLRLSSLLAAFALLGGCAHSIVITPDAGKLGAPAAKLSANKVGYFISDDERTRKVISPGGGGDRVEYAPYKELEAGIYRALSNVFASVDQLKSENDPAVIAEKKINFVMRPKITTNSSSSSPFTWPPTDFDVIIEIKAFDNNGKIIWQDTVIGKGKAEFSEFKSDFALSARRASEAALIELQKKLISSPLM